jgi:hypothetical protein
MGVGFPSVLLVPIPDPFYQELMVSRVIVIGASCNDDLGGPSLAVCVDVDRGWGPVGITAVRFQQGNVERGVDSPMRGQVEGGRASITSDTSDTEGSI